MTIAVLVRRKGFRFLPIWKSVGNERLLGPTAHLQQGNLIWLCTDEFKILKLYYTIIYIKITKILKGDVQNISCYSPHRSSYRWYKRSHLAIERATKETKCSVCLLRVFKPLEIFIPSCKESPTIAISWECKIFWLTRTLWYNIISRISIGRYRGRRIVVISAKIEWLWLGHSEH